MPTQTGEPEAAPRAALPRWAALGAGLLGLLLFAMVALLALTLAQLRDSGGHIEAQDKKIAALFELGRPFAARADQVTGEVGPALDGAAEFAAPLLRSDSGADLAAALDRLPITEGAVRRLAAEAIPLFDRAVPLLDQADPALLSGTLATLGSLAAALEQEDRLVRLIDGASAALVDVSDHDLVNRAAKSAARLRKLLAVQRETRAIQARTLGVQLRSLDVQRRSLEHVRSIDRKTGGEIPPAPVP